jgi:hypothetical protein
MRANVIPNSETQVKKALIYIICFCNKVDFMAVSVHHVRSNAVLTGSQGMIKYEVRTK